jgi:hypothetical protein
MLDDHRGKAVAAIGDFGHRASLPSASLPSYPVTLTADSGGSRPRIRDDVAQHSDLISLGVPR